MNFYPEDDGITHINIYSKGQTKLGVMLSNFYYAPFECEDGTFDSIEGYWYWLGCKDDRLRTASGFRAKALGRHLRAADWSDEPEFKAKIKNAIKLKIGALPELQRLMVRNKLPYTHYYNFKGKIIRVPEADWIIKYITHLAGDLKYES